MTGTQELEQKALAIPDQAMALEITDAGSYQVAAELLLTVKALLKEVDATFNPIIEKQYQAHREALAQKKRHQDPLLKAEQILKPRLAKFLHDEEQKRLQAERAMQEAATLQEAVDAEARGDTTSADAAMNGQGVASVTAPPTVQKVAGIASREIWRAEIGDKMALIKAVATGQAPSDLLDVNQSVANQMARALKTGMQYPGLKAVCEKTVAAGARL